MNNYDLESLRQDLIDYFTSAMFNVSYVAMIDLIEIENASISELIRLAEQNGFNLNNYKANIYKKNI